MRAPGDAALIEKDDAVDLDLVKISQDDMRSWRKLGLELEQAGAVHVDGGAAYITKRVAIGALEALESQLKDANGEELHLLAGSIAKLCRAMADIISKTRGGVSENKQPQAPRRTFAPNQTAVFAKEVHIHESQRDEKSV